MSKDYNIFYKDKTSNNIVKLKEDLSSNLNSNLAVSSGNSPFFNILKLSKFNTFKRLEMRLQDFENKGFFLVDFNTLFAQNLNEDILSFLNIKEAVNYLYETYSVPYCTDCKKTLSKFSISGLKDIILNAQNLNSSCRNLMLIISFKISNTKSERLEKLGIFKIINNLQIKELSEFNNAFNDAFNKDKALKNSFAIYKTHKIKNINDDNESIKIFNSIKELEEKLEEIPEKKLENKLGEKEIKLFFFDNDKQELVEEREISFNDFVCLECNKTFKPFISVDIKYNKNVKYNKNIKYNKKEEYIYNDLPYSSFSLLPIKDLTKNINDKLKSDSFLGREILVAIKDRLELLNKFLVSNVSLNTLMKNLSFNDFFKIMLSVIFKALPKNVSLVIKDIFDCLEKKEKGEFLKLVNENFENYFLLSKNEILSKESVPIFNIKEYNFFTLQEKVKNKKVKILGDYDNLYKKIVKLYLSSFDISSSNLKERDFSLSKLNTFLDGKEEGEHFVKYKVLGVSFIELISMNIESLKDTLQSFKNISKSLEMLCDLGLGDEYLLSESFSSPKFIAKSL